jgi:methylated-DNA-protein-cysteine methyltransferase-like protein
MDSSDRSHFFERVWDVVARIPYGKVTTYGHIAEHLGLRSAARTVGWALNSAAGSGLPAHRVVNRFGALSGRRHFEGPFVMEERLRSEGVTFTDDGCVNLEKHLWVPD